MARHGLYGLFWQEIRPDNPALGSVSAFRYRAMWAMARNKRVALREGRKRSAVVTRMDLPQSTSWDAPTFKACSDVIADFRD
jgi:hypothetical protein